MEAWMPSGLGQNMSPMKLPDESDDWGDNILFHQQFEGTSGTRVFDPEPHLTGDFGHLHSLKSGRMHRAWSKPHSVCHWIQRLAMEGENDEFWLRFLLLWIHCHRGLGSFSPFLRQRLVLRFYVYSCLWFSMVQRSNFGCSSHHSFRPSWRIFSFVVIITIITIITTTKIYLMWLMCLHVFLLVALPASSLPASAPVLSCADSRPQLGPTSPEQLECFRHSSLHRSIDGMPPVTAKGPCQTREAISADQPIITLNENWIQNLDRKRLKFISITWWSWWQNS